MVPIFSIACGIEFELLLAVVPLDLLYITLTSVWYMRIVVGQVRRSFSEGTRKVFAEPLCGWNCHVSSSVVVRTVFFGGCVTCTCGMLEVKESIKSVTKISELI